MKDQITNLVRFFGALSAMVEHVVKRNVKDFIQQVESAQKLLIGNISLLDISRQVGSPPYLLSRAPQLLTR